MGDTTGASDKFQAVVSGPGVGNCGGGPWSGPDLVYAVTPTGSGSLTMSVNLSAMQWGSTLLRVRSVCPGMTSDEIYCQYAGGGMDSLQVPVTSGTTYYVVVDSYANKSGPFSLKLTVQ